ncbi:uncharacterized protein LOC134187022 isoform X2 [Corticium candelabrum]|uniref:uncharacterized protein LOC134187022 isoform X2 n=1 Tax=Corticium candelabrum TaxID=121492 RepID=UPI002E27677F|nr:uncharacterized protein LOC134187022 isoform X2 [Corticium candelabrum]
MWAKKLVRRYTGKEDYEFGDITTETLRRVGGAIGWLVEKAEKAACSNENSVTTPSSLASVNASEARRPNCETSSTVPNVEPSAPVQDDVEAFASAPTLADVSFPPAAMSCTQPDDFVSRHVHKATGAVDVELIWDSLLNRAFFIGKQYLSSGHLTKDDFLSCEPFLYLGLPAVTLFEAAARSVGYRGIVIATGLEIDESTCPHEHKAVYTAIATIRDFVQALSLRQSEFGIVQRTLLFNSDPTKEIHDRDTLDEERKKEINRLVSQVNSIASGVTQMAFFKEHFNGIIQRLARC